jgi:hypothetical protein
VSCRVPRLFSKTWCRTFESSQGAAADNAGPALSAERAGPACCLLAIARIRAELLCDPELLERLGAQVVGLLAERLDLRAEVGEPVLGPVGV